MHRDIAYVPGDVTLWPNLSGGETIDLLTRPARRRGPGSARAADPRLRVRPAQEGAQLLEGQPPEGRAHRGVRPAGEALHLRRADQRARPADGVGLPRGDRAGAGGRRDRAAVEPHPQRGRAALRPRHDHPRRCAVETGTLDRAPAPHPHRFRVGPAATERLRRLPGVATRAPRGTRSLRCRDGCRGRRARGAPRGRERADRDTALARGAVPAALRRPLEIGAGGRPVRTPAPGCGGIASPAVWIVGTGLSRVRARLGGADQIRDATSGPEILKVAVATPVPARPPRPARRWHASAPTSTSSCSATSR